MLKKRSRILILCFLKAKYSCNTNKDFFLSFWLVPICHSCVTVNFCHHEDSEDLIYWIVVLLRL